jgi:hypothetical protein
VFEHAYRATLQDLAARRRSLAPRLARYGISIRGEVLHRVAAPHAASHPLAKLGGALDRLERWMGAQ